MDRYRPMEPLVEVASGLSMGTNMSVRRELCNRRITHIVLAHDEALDWGEWVGEENRCTLRDIPHDKISDYFLSTFNFIEKALTDRGAHVVVCCDDGQSRSPALVLAYLIRKNKQSLKECFLSLREKKKGISPNNGYMSQLLDLDKEIMGCESMKRGMFKDPWGFGLMEFLLSLHDPNPVEDTQKDSQETAQETAQEGGQETEAKDELTNEQKADKLKSLSMQFEMLRKSNRSRGGFMPSQ